jgi:large subunit ribosomal protein L17
MKKRVNVKLLREKGQTRSDGKNIIHSLFKYGAIKTSTVRAKRLKSLVDRLINYGFKEELQALRLIKQKVGHQSTTKQIIEYAKRFKGNKKSGFTSLKKVGFRRGDATEISRLVLIDFGGKLAVTETKKNVKKT